MNLSILSNKSLSLVSRMSNPHERLGIIHKSLKHTNAPAPIFQSVQKITVFPKRVKRDV